jgi:hypothetical protein
MRKLIFAINITLDGCCDHTKQFVDEETLEYFTHLTREVDLQVFGRKTYQLMVPLRANIRETPVVPLINEQGEKEKGRDEWHFSWCSFLGGFGWRGTERRRAKRAAAQRSGSQSGRRLPAGLAS